MDGHIDASLVRQSHGGGLSWLNQGNNWVQILSLCQGRGQEPLQTGLNFYLIYAPSNAVDGHMDASLVHQSHVGGLSWLNQGNNWVQTLPLCHGRGQEPLQTE